MPVPDPERARSRTALYRTLIALRRERIAPYLDGARSEGTRVLGPKAVLARWRLGGERLLTITTNLDSAAVDMDEPPKGELLFASKDLPTGTLPGYCTSAYIADPP